MARPYQSAWKSDDAMEQKGGETVPKCVPREYVACGTIGLHDRNSIEYISASYVRQVEEMTPRLDLFRRKITALHV